MVDHAPVANTGPAARRLSGEPLAVLLIAAAVGGTAPYLLRIATQLFAAQGSATPPAMPPMGVWIGILIFGLLGIGVAYVFADRQRRHYFTSAMMAPALITNAAVGAQQAKTSTDQSVQASAGTSTSLDLPFSLTSRAFAQDPEPSPVAPELAKGFRTLQVDVGIKDAASLGSPQAIAIAPEGAAEGGPTQTCTVLTGITCSIIVPEATESVSIDIGGMTRNVTLSPSTDQLNVELLARPDFGQKVWWALGGNLEGDVTDFSAAAE